MKKLQIKKYRLDNAKHCFISRGRLNDHLAGLYGRDPLKTCIKVFDKEEIENVDDFYNVKWGDDPQEGNPRKNSNLFHATQIQNICSWYGLAPRVYGLEAVEIGDRFYPAQFCEFVPEEKSYYDFEAVYRKVVELGKQYGFGIEKEDVSNADVIGGKLIDFQTFDFTRPYKETAKEIYIEKSRYGKVYYQDVPKIGLTGGPRKSEQRIKELGLDKLDFNGKTVMDVGCAGGYFVRYARQQGAKRSIGIDTLETIEGAMHISNLLGYFNVDFISLDLEKYDPQISDIDITLFLSLNYHIGFPEWLKNTNLMVLEDNGKESRNSDTPPEPVKSWFKDWELVGHATDHGNKPIYHLK